MRFGLEIAVNRTEKILPTIQADGNAAGCLTFGRPATNLSATLRAKKHEVFLAEFLMTDGSGDWGKGLAQGLEVAVGAGLGYLIGHWLGRKFGWGPWGDFGGVMIGCAAGMYSLIKESVRSDKKK